MAAENLVNALDIGSADVKAVIRWSRLLFVEAMKQTFASQFMGDGPMAMIQRLMDLSREPGDSIRYDLLVQLADMGVAGNTVLKGSEQTLTYYQDSVNVNQTRQALGNFRLSQQRTIHNLRSDSMRNLSDWFARLIDTFMFAWLSGHIADVGGFTGVSAAFDAFFGTTGGPPVHDAGHKAVARSTTFSVDDIDYAVHQAKTLTPPIQPLRIQGGDYWVMFITNRQAYNLRKAPGSGQNDYFTSLQQARERAPSNPLFRGALGMWNNVILHENQYLPIVAGTPNINPAVLCGRQAGVMAFGNAIPRLDGKSAMGQGNQNGVPFYWHEEVDDYANRIGVAASGIFGMKRTVFNSASFGIYVVETDDVAIT